MENSAGSNGETCGWMETVKGQKGRPIQQPGPGMCEHCSPTTEYRPPLTDTIRPSIPENARLSVRPSEFS